MVTRITALTALFLGWSAPVLADADQGGYGGHMHWMGEGWSHFVFGPVMMILVLAAIVVLIVVVLRAVGPQKDGGSQAPGPEPLDILKERFARGEIDAEEFEARRKVIKK